MQVEDVVLDGERFVSTGFNEQGLEGGGIGRGLADGGVDSSGVFGGEAGVGVGLDESGELVGADDQDFGGEFEGGGEFRRQFPGDGCSCPAGLEKDIARLDVVPHIAMAQPFVELAQWFHFDRVSAGDVDPAIEGDEEGHVRRINDEWGSMNGAGFSPSFLNSRASLLSFGDYGIGK